MTTKIPDERLRELIHASSLYTFGGYTGRNWQDDAVSAIRELQEKRALVKESEAYMQHKDECKLQPDCVCGLDALLARVRGDT